MMLSLDTAYRSFCGEVEASSTPTICRLPDSRRHQLWAIARCCTARARDFSVSKFLEAGVTRSRLSYKSNPIGICHRYGTRFKPSIYSEENIEPMADLSLRLLRLELVCLGTDFLA